MAVPIPYTGAVEGPTDEVALRRIVREAGRSIETVYTTCGKSALLRRLPGFNAAAEHAPWIVLVDLNGTPCAPDLIAAQLPAPAAQMCFRVVVRALESWVLADRDRLATFLGVRVAAIPADPDLLPNPKLALVDIARRSRRRAIRDDMVPKEGSGRPVGPAYEARLIEFLSDETDGWRPIVAAASSDSLRRALNAIS